MPDKYQLKPGHEAFDVVDGPDAGKRFRPGRTYAEIPASEKHRFKKIVPPAAPAPKPSKAKPAAAAAAETSKTTKEKEV